MDYTGISYIQQFLGIYSTFGKIWLNPEAKGNYYLPKDTR